MGDCSRGHEPAVIQSSKNLRLPVAISYNNSYGQDGIGQNKTRAGLGQGSGAVQFSQPNVKCCAVKSHTPGLVSECLACLLCPATDSVCTVPGRAVKAR